MDPEGELCALEDLFEEIKHHIKVIANAHGVMTYYLSQEILEMLKYLNKREIEGIHASLDFSCLAI
jgi:hypothetical protein